MARGKRDRFTLREIGRSQRVAVLKQIFVGSGKNNAAALLAGFRAKVNDKVALFDDLRIMFDDDNRVLVGSETVKNLH